MLRSQVNVIYVKRVLNLILTPVRQSLMVSYICKYANCIKC
jgi:hypothetical protein